MDEHSFDDYIKQKIGNYEDPSFDESAFNAFQNRLSSVQRVSWYKQYKTEIIVISAFILFTLLNSYVMWSVFSKDKNTNDTSLIKSYNVNTIFANQIDSLSKVIQDLKNENDLLVRNNIIPSSAQKDNYTADRNDLSRHEDEYKSSDENDITDGQVLIGEENALPASLVKLLKDNNLLAMQDGKAYLIKSDVVEKENYEHAFQNTLTAKTINKPVIIYLPSETPTLPAQEEEDIHQRNVSAKVKNDLEKHYHHGIGINVAPHADLVMNAFSESEAALSPRAGITFDWVVSPHFSFETSFDYMNTRFITNKNLDKWNVDEHIDGPWGNLQKLSISTQNLSVPLGVKYRTWINGANELTLRTTYTPYYSLNQKILCSYSGVGGYNGDDASINKIESREIKKFYGSSLKFSVGLQHQLKKKNKIETSLFYEKSLGTVGPQHNQMQLYGVNLSYWFKLK